MSTAAAGQRDDRAMVPAAITASPMAMASTGRLLGWNLAAVRVLRITISSRTTICAAMRTHGWRSGPRAMVHTLPRKRVVGIRHAEYFYLQPSSYPHAGATPGTVRPNCARRLTTVTNDRRHHGRHEKPLSTPPATCRKNIDGAGRARGRGSRAQCVYLPARW